MGERRVVFGRINRRYQDSFDESSFRNEMQMLAELGRFEAAQSNSKRWIVGNIELHRKATFLTGIIGFADPEIRLHFNETSDSWTKGISELVAGASSQAVVPFAVDLRPDRRWTASVTSSRIRAETFCRGIERAINVARSQLGLNPDWEVDVVTSRTAVNDWIELHPEIRRIKRIIKLPNPRRDISKDIADMQDLAAQRKEEQYTAGRGQRLRAVDESGRTSDAIQNLTAGVETGQVEIDLEARGPNGSYKFRSVTNADSVRIRDFMNDLEVGIELVLMALDEYSGQRAG